MKFRRGLARDRFVLDDALVEKICKEGEAESGLRAKRIDQLEACLLRLPRERREFVMEAYAPGASIKEMAVKRGKKPDALYQLLRRIRRELEVCVDAHVKEGKAGE